MRRKKKQQDESVSEEEIHAKAPGWYERWRGRIHHWVSTATDDIVADILLVVPDMFMLMVRLLRDRRVPFIVKGQLIIALAYVLNPFDLIPEAVAGVIGLTDDAGVMALVLMWIKSMMDLDKEILRDNWSGEDDPAEVIEEVHEKISANADKIFRSGLWEKIRERVHKMRHSDNPEDIVEGYAERVQPKEDPKQKSESFWRGKKRFRRVPIS